MIIKKTDFEEKNLRKKSKEELITLVREISIFLSRVHTKKKKITGEVTLIMTDVNTGEIEVTKYKNIIPLVGRVAITRLLLSEGLKENEGKITYGAVGTGNTSAASGDTTLETELFRKTIASTKRVSNTIYIRTFLTTSEGNGELKEFGLFGEDASATTDSGTLFERVIIDKTKTTAKTLLIESVITIE